MVSERLAFKAAIRASLQEEARAREKDQQALLHQAASQADPIACIGSVSSTMDYLQGVDGLSDRKRKGSSDDEVSSDAPNKKAKTIAQQRDARDQWPPAVKVKALRDSRIRQSTEDLLAADVDATNNDQRPIMDEVEVSGASVGAFLIGEDDAGSSISDSIVVSTSSNGVRSKSITEAPNMVETEAMTDISSLTEFEEDCEEGSRTAIGPPASANSVHTQQIQPESVSTASTTVDGSKGEYIDHSGGQVNTSDVQTPLKTVTLQLPTPESLKSCSALASQDQLSPLAMRHSVRSRKSPPRFPGLTGLPSDEEIEALATALAPVSRQASTTSRQMTNKAKALTKCATLGQKPGRQVSKVTKTNKATQGATKSQKASKVPKTQNTPVTPDLQKRTKTPGLSAATKAPKARSAVKLGLATKKTPQATRVRAASTTKLKLTLKLPVGHAAAGRIISPASAALQTELQLPPDSQGTGAEELPLGEIDRDLLALSTHMTSRLPVTEKPEPSGQPLVWADSRQALCETVPYFKKPQGGCHQNDKHVYAFLFDGVGHCREYMDSDVIIARAGGGMECDVNGHMVQKKHQSMQDAQVQAVQNDIVLQNPFIIICGDKNTGTLTKMPHKYCVLGWYKPIAVWSEKTAGKGQKAWKTIKYRFERLNSNPNATAWHAPKEEIDFPHMDKAGQIRYETCSDCGKSWPRVYLCGWMCFNADCRQFWKLEGRDAPCESLAYDPAFLLKRHPWQDETEPYSVVPKLPDVGKVLGDHVRYINTRGMCCPLCGRCNSRYLFSHWRCDNPDCSWTLRPQHAALEPAALHSPWDNCGDGPALARNKHDNSVNVKVEYKFGYKVYTYTFDGIDGSFVHAVANNKINREPLGPNHMLNDMQTTDMGLERRRFGGEKMSGVKAERSIKDVSLIVAGQSTLPAETGTSVDSTCTQDTTAPLPTPPTEEVPVLAGDINTAEDEAPRKPEVEDGDFMTAFSMNYGMPYKFVAGGASRPFEDAPVAVRASRSRLNWAARAFLDSVPAEHDFNEELIFAYMEGQKIEYHDDGEEGLGPRIATLSLGGKAKMHMRMKMKHFVGCSKTGVLTQEEPRPGSIGGEEMYRKRHAAWVGLQRLKETDKVAYRKRLTQIPKELGIYDKRNKKADDLVTITLSHGDIVLMDGYEIQKYLEHKVVPEDHLRFALTCREVLANHLSESERPAYEVHADDYGYDGSKTLDW